MGADYQRVHVHKVQIVAGHFVQLHPCLCSASSGCSQLCSCVHVCVRICLCLCSPLGKGSRGNRALLRPHVSHQALHTHQGHGQNASCGLQGPLQPS